MEPDTKAKQIANSSIIFYGMDLGKEDRTAYWLYDGETFKEIDENEYRRLSKQSVQ